MKNNSERVLWEGGTNWIDTKYESKSTSEKGESECVFTLKFAVKEK